MAPASSPVERVFGLVVRDTLTGALMLSQSRLPLDQVLPDIAANLSEQILLRHHEGLKSDEIKAARAYLARFGESRDAPRPLPAGPKSLLLDENIPYTLLPLVHKLFGFSSHVEAEGLSRQNLAEEHRVPRSALDSRICRFAAENDFAGVVTGDTDFIELYSYPAHPVRKLHVFLMDGRESLSVEKRLIRHQAMIRSKLAGQTPDLVRL